MYPERWRYWSKTKIIAQECTQSGEGIDPKHFVSLLYISVDIKASLLKFSVFNIHKNTISNMFLVFSNFKIVDLIGIAILILPPACFWKTAGGIVLGSVAVSTV